MKKMPVRRFAHAATFCGSEIVVVGGISDLSLDMQLRSVPIGEEDCYAFNVYESTWRQLPDVPIGKLYPTLITINSRYVFQIGGFDDYDFDIYRLDLHSPDKLWKTYTLDQT